MARVPYLDKSDLAPENHDLLKRMITLHRALVHSPNAARAFGGLGQFIRHKSRLARAPYEWSHHLKIGREFGVSTEDIRALIDESEGKPTKLEPLAKLVLKGAREMTEDGAMSKATFDALSRDLDKERMVDLVVTIGFYNAVVRVLASLEIDVEPDYQPYLDEFPLPAAGKGRK